MKNKILIIILLFQFYINTDVVYCGYYCVGDLAVQKFSSLMAAHDAAYAYATSLNNIGSCTTPEPGRSVYYSVISIASGYKVCSQGEGCNYSDYFIYDPSMVTTTTPTTTVTTTTCKPCENPNIFRLTASSRCNFPGHPEFTVSEWQDTNDLDNVYSYTVNVEAEFLDDPSSPFNDPQKHGEYCRTSLYVGNSGAKMRFCDITGDLCEQPKSAAILPDLVQPLPMPQLTNAVPLNSDGSIDQAKLTQQQLDGTQAIVNAINNQNETLAKIANKELNVKLSAESKIDISGLASAIAEKITKSFSDYFDASNASTIEGLNSISDDIDNNQTNTAKSSLGIDEITNDLKSKTTSAEQELTNQINTFKSNPKIDALSKKVQFLTMSSNCSSDITLTINNQPYIIKLDFCDFDELISKLGQLLLAGVYVYCAVLVFQEKT